MNDDLLLHLCSLPPGRIEATQPLEKLLAGHWDQFDGDDGGMAGYKLLGRMEAVEWDGTRLLTFTIERHGGTVLGSSRATLQRWTLDLEAGTRTCVEKGHRQLRPMQPGVKVAPIAEEIVSHILDRKDDPRLRWESDGRVTVMVEKQFPNTSACKQTLEGRRKRLRDAIRQRLEGRGWVEEMRDVFVFRQPFGERV